MHYVHHGWHLRELHWHHNFDEQRLLRLRKQQGHSEVLRRLRVVHHHCALEVLEDLLDLLGAHILHRVSTLLHLLLLHHLLRHSHARLLARMRELLLAVCSPLAHDVALRWPVHSVHLLLPRLDTIAHGRLHLPLLLLLVEILSREVLLIWVHFFIIFINQLKNLAKKMLIGCSSFSTSMFNRHVTKFKQILH